VSAISAMIRVIGAASGHGTRSRASHNPSGVGSSPTRPTCGSMVYGERPWTGSWTDVGGPMYPAWRPDHSAPALPVPGAEYTKCVIERVQGQSCLLAIHTGEPSSPRQGWRTTSPGRCTSREWRPVRSRSSPSASRGFPQPSSRHGSGVHGDLPAPALRVAFGEKAPTPAWPTRPS